MGETRRKFDRDFREGAVRLVRETGKPIAQVARDLGIRPPALKEPRPVSSHTHPDTSKTTSDIGVHRERRQTRSRCSRGNGGQQVSVPGGLLCALEPWLRLNLEISVVGVDCHEEMVQEAF